MASRRLCLAAVLCLTSALPASATPTSTTQVGWHPIGPPGGQVAAMAASPSVSGRVYVAGLAGIFRSTDGGVSWEWASRGLPPQAEIRLLRIDPTDADVLFAFEWTNIRGIYRTSDGGRTWSKWSNGNGSHFSDVAFDPFDSNVLLATGGNVQRSTDGGKTWALFSTGGPTRWLAFHPTQPSVVLGASPTGVYRSTDGGLTWMLLHQSDPYQVDGPPDAGDFAWSPSDPSRVYVGTDTHPCLRSTDGGLTFTQRSFPTNKMSACFAIDPVNADHLLALSLWWEDVGWNLLLRADVYSSTNGGATWVRTLQGSTSSEYLIALGIAFDPANPSAACVAMSNSRPDQLRRSTDGGATWAVSTSGFTSQKVFAVQPLSSGALVVRGMEFAGIFRRDVSGSWSELPHQMTYLGRLTPQQFEANRRNPEVMVDAGYWMATDTGGYYAGVRRASGNWSVIYEGYSSSLLLVTNHGDGSLLYFWVGNSLYSSQTPFFTETLVSTAFHARAAVIHPQDSLVLFAAVSGVDPVRRSTDGGVSWVSRSAGLPSATPVDLMMDPDHPDHIAVVFSDRAPWVTTDAGSTWSSRSVDLLGHPVVDAEWDPATENILLALDGSIVVSTRWGRWDGGLLPVGPIRLGVDTARGLVYAASRGGVFSRRMIGGTDVGEEPTNLAQIAEATTGAAPVSSRLFEAYPNPAQAEIFLRLSPQSPTSVSVYDASGRLVRALQAGAGPSTLRWDGCDGTGRAVSAGVYFLHAHNSGAEQVTRVVLLR